jgi:flagellar biosynthesis protein FlhA
VLRAEGEAKTASKAAEVAAGSSAGRAKADTPEAQLHVDMLELELGSALLPLVDRSGGDLLGRISQIRKKLASELGFIMPAIRVRDNLSLPSRHYRLKVRGAPVAEHELHPDRLLAINPGKARSGVEGQPTTDPAFGLPALWVATSQRVRAEACGYTVVEPISVLATHLQELIRGNSADLLTRQDVHKILERVKETDPGLVKDVVPGAVSLATLHRVLQSLLRERVPIRDLTSILEVLGDNAGQPRSVEALASSVREALAPSFAGSLADEQNRILAIACEPALESRLLQSIAQTERGPMLVLMPDHVTALVKRISDETAAAQKRRQKPVLLCSAGLRAHLRHLLERVLPSLPVLAYTEVPRRTTLEIIAHIPAGIVGGEGAKMPAHATEREPAARR